MNLEPINGFFYLNLVLSNIANFGGTTITENHPFFPPYSACHLSQRDITLLGCYTVVLAHSGILKRIAGCTL